jgi:hypothetical protein
VDHVVGLAVPGAGQPVPEVFTGGSVQGCGTSPGGEPVPVGEPGHVTDVSQDPGGDHRPTLGERVKWAV